jgi:excisionase family DNA binding protein
MRLNSSNRGCQNKPGTGGYWLGLCSKRPIPGGEANLKEVYMTRDEFISAKEVCDCLGLDLTTVYQMARIGEIPGAIWGETLRFDLEEFKEWFDWVAEEAALRTLEEDGVLMSFVDSDGQRIYVPTRRTLH